ncbi:hypothetical protein PRV_01070 [Mycoplasma parvum str. Indiana]|uniref:Uncharacterized protein n=1 Tax=Mycoplasma parvum str. Indiana TaxID=1403316 RepID=U5NFH6_9MOLU|nr:hypothetical protein PRV_01070 [Mycoplasma parvum str. Indiana]
MSLFFNYLLKMKLKKYFPDYLGKKEEEWMMEF